MPDRADQDSIRGPMTYTPGTILTTDQVAEWIQVSSRHVELMNLPRLKGLGRVTRYEAGALLRYLMGDMDAAPCEWTGQSDSEAQVSGRPHDPARYRHGRPASR